MKKPLITILCRVCKDHGLTVDQIVQNSWDEHIKRAREDFVKRARQEGYGHDTVWRPFEISVRDCGNKTQSTL